MLVAIVTGLPAEANSRREVAKVGYYSYWLLLILVTLDTGYSQGAHVSSIQYPASSI
jgi:hypothetical protein